METLTAEQPSITSDTFPAAWATETPTDASVIEPEAFDQTPHFSEQDQTERQPLPKTERCLTEVDNLNRSRDSNGKIPEWVLRDVHVNLIARAKELAMPYAINRVKHAYQATGERDENGRLKGSFVWLGRTVVAHALSGKAYHKHEEALKRVDVEIDEAVHNETAPQPGYKQFFISPRMTETDAPEAIAKAEHLHADDALRCTEAFADAQGNIEYQIMESGLVRDIPLEAWVAMLEDPSNMFGRAIVIANPESALSVMKVHKVLRVPSEAAPDGIVNLIEAVIPHIKDPAARQNVEHQVRRFRAGQAEMHAEAESVADRWLDFDVALADSLQTKRATSTVENFIHSLDSKWGDEDRAVIAAHQISGTSHFRMSRKLAIVVEQAEENLLGVPAAIVAGNEKVLAQMTPAAAAQIYHGEMELRTAIAGGYEAEALRRMEYGNNRHVADQNAKVGGGCTGLNEANFKDGDSDGGLDGMASGEAGSSSRRSKAARLIARIIKCIKCRRPSPKEKIINEKEDTWSCPHCKYKVEACTGKVLHKSESRKRGEHQASKPALNRRLGGVATKATLQPDSSRSRGETHAGARRRIKSKSRAEMTALYQVSKAKAAAV